MSSVMTRSFADYMGFKWPKGVACIVNGKPVTYSQLLADRKERQTKRLQLVRDCRSPVRCAAYVWTFYQPGLFGFAYAGWHLYIRTLKHEWWMRSRDGMNTSLIAEIMEMFPCGLLPIPENFERWKEAFGKTYSRPGRFKQQGLVLGWAECSWEGAYPNHFKSQREST